MFLVDGRHSWIRYAFIAVIVFLLSASVMAANNSVASAGRTPKPIIETGKGDQCVEDTDYMRKNHMKLLMHQRDETMHKGIRTTKHSLKNCIECHASQKNNSVAANNENFCQTCHAYTAVKIDCFECHASKPKASTAFHRIVPSGAKGEAHQSHALAAKMRGQFGKVAQGEVGVKR